jgi:hypothetical protein
VCSNSSGDRPARRLLAAAFGVLCDEAPIHHANLRAVLAQLIVHIVVGGDAFAPELAADRLAVGDPRGAAQVTLRTELATALALFEGRRTIVAAVTHGELDVRGSPDALDAAAAAFAHFLHGLVRAPSSAALLDQLRDVVTSNPEGDHV